MWEDLLYQMLGDFFFLNKAIVTRTVVLARGWKTSLLEETAQKKTHTRFHA